MPASDPAPVAVTTGGAGGIGAATAACLIEAGWRVAIADHDAERVEVVAAELGAMPLPFDIADADAVAAGVARVERDLGPVSGLVACAAHLENPHPPEAQDMDEFDRIMTVNLRGTFLTVTRFGERMLARGGGSIVTIGSITALNSSPLVAYGPSKAGIIAMTRDFAGAWGRRGVRVNCVCPGPTRTPAVEASYARGERDPGRMIAQTALGRLVAPREVGEVVAFLLSDRARAVTGAVIPVDAGVLVTQLWSLYGGIPTG